MYYLFPVFLLFSEKYTKSRFPVIPCISRSFLSVKNNSGFIRFQSTCHMMSVVRDQLFAFFSFKQITWYFFVCEVTSYHQFLILQCSLVCINIIVIFQKSLEHAFHNNLILMTQLDQFLIIIEYTVLIFQCCLRVDLYSFYLR